MNSESRESTGGWDKLLRWVALACAIFAIVQTLSAARSADVTWDEPAHFLWSNRLYQYGITERVSRPYFDSKTPILIPNIIFAHLFGFSGDDLPGTRADLFLLRAPTTIYVIGLLALTFFIARNLWGRRAAYLALVAVSLDPNLAAHSSLLTVDGIFAFTTLLVVFCAYHFWTKLDWKSALLLGASVGMAFTAKFTAVLLLPIALVLPPVCGILPTDRKTPLLRRTIVMLALATLTFWLVVSSSYGFHGIGRSVDPEAWHTPFMRTLATHVPWALTSFPVDFLSGFDICLSLDRTESWNSVVMLAHYPNGVWFYFPLCWLLKSPLPLLIFSVAGLGRGVVKGLLWRDAKSRFVALTLIVFLVYFCLIFRTQKGYRYVLMCIPLLYLLAARGLDGMNVRRAFPYALITGTLWSLGEQAVYGSNVLSFTNSFILDKKNVYRYLTDSNVDWKQNDAKVNRWIANRPSSVLNPPHLVVGENVISVNYWTGVVGGATDKETQYGPLRGRREPDRHLFHSHLVFDVSDREFETILNTSRLLPEYDPCPLDAGSLSQRAVHGEAQNTLQIDSDAVICLTPRYSADIVLRPVASRSALGHWRSFGSFASETIDKGKESWYRVPGRGVLFTRGGPFMLEVKRGTVDIQTGKIGDNPISLEGIQRKLLCSVGVRLTRGDGAPQELFVRGSWTEDWGAWESTKMQFADGCYFAHVPLVRRRKAYEFKIGPSDWREGVGTSAFGGQQRNTEAVLGQVMSLAVDAPGFKAPDMLLSVNETETYIVQLMVPASGTPTLVVAKDVHP